MGNDPVAFIEVARQHGVNDRRVIILVVVVDQFLPVGFDDELLAVNQRKFINSRLVVAQFPFQPGHLR